MNNIVDIIIPTWNNPTYLYPCVTSLLRNNATENLFHIYIINNGYPESIKIENPHVTVIDAGENLGWEGGLKLGLQYAKAPFVVFHNDDTYIPPISRLWLNHLLQHFKDSRVGAVGPSSNVVMGRQNIFADIPAHIFPVKYLIGFCMVLRREALEKAGGVDDTLPGGDDFDLSIRLRDAGYTLLADRSVFVYHHGFKTGERVYGTADKANGWNSYEFKEKTDFALIKKHGFRKWYELIMSTYEQPKISWASPWEDTEGAIIQKKVKGKKILDLGCGNNKTLPNAIGVDMVYKDDLVETLVGRPKSVADVQADVSLPLPFEKDSVDTIIARHILEHMVDPITVIQQWKEVLKKKGKLIIAVPNQDLNNSIPMNVEHVHAWNPYSMRKTLELAGMKVVEQIDPNNGISFITIAEKI